MKSKLLYFASLLIFLVTLVIIEHVVGWRNILNQMYLLPIGPMIGLLMLTLGNYLLRVWRIHQSFGLFRNQISTSFYITTYHNLLNILIPMRLGEASFPLLMKRYLSLSYTKSTSHLLIYRLFDLVVLVSFFILTLGFLNSVTLFAFALVALGFSFAFIKPLAKLLSFIFAKLPLTICQNIAKAMNEQIALEGQLARIYFITWLIWSVKLLAFVLFCQLVSNLPSAELLFNIIVADLSSVLPIHGFAGTGTFEGGFVLGGWLQTHKSTEMLQIAVQLHAYLLVGAALSAALGWFCLVFTRGSNKASAVALQGRDV